MISVPIPRVVYPGNVAVVKSCSLVVAASAAKRSALKQQLTATTKSPTTSPLQFQRKWPPPPTPLALLTVRPMAIVELQAEPASLSPLCSPCDLVHVFMSGRDLSLSSFTRKRLVMVLRLRLLLCLRDHIQLNPALHAGRRKQLQLVEPRRATLEC